MNKKAIKNDKLSILFQSLYLANLLLLPGIFFLILIYYFSKYRSTNNKPLTKEHQEGTFNEEDKVNLQLSRIGRIHLFRAIQLSVIAGVLLVIIPLVVIVISNQQEASIMIALIYFVTLHASFVLIGMFNLSRAMAKKLPLF